MLKDRGTPCRGRHWPTLLTTTLWLATLSAQATTTYRCEVHGQQAGAQAEVRYQHQACEGGRAVDVTDHRTRAQQQHTTQATQTTAKLGRQLERDRRRQEKASKGQGPVAMDDPQRKPDWTPTSTQGQTLKRHRPFTARVPKAASSPA